MVRPAFQPDRDIPDLSGKVIIVTGGNVGLGKESILEFAKHNPAKIYMASRSKEKAEITIAEILLAVPKAKIFFLHMDLSSLVSVQKGAETFLKENMRLDILMNNAGIMATPPSLTQDGYEMQFGTNHMGHALLTKLLLPTMQKTAKENPTASIRTINLSSEAHRWAPPSGISFKHLKTTQADITTTTRYAQSKLANLYHAEALAKRYPEITSVAIHPGVIATNIAGNFRKGYPLLGWLVETLGGWVLKNPRTGALTQIWAAVANREDVKSGGFYYPVGKPFVGQRRVDADALGDELWEWTEKELTAFLARR